jgi:hypothetical protein
VIGGGDRGAVGRGGGGAVSLVQLNERGGMSVLARPATAASSCVIKEIYSSWLDI